MIYITILCAALMIISELLSILIFSSHSNAFYSFIGLDIESIHYECMKLAKSFDINKCYIDGTRVVTYVTRWPYVMAYSILFSLSFYSLSSCIICAIMSLLFMIYRFYFDGLNAVAPWVNFFVLLICAYRARRIIYGSKHI